MEGGALEGKSRTGELYLMLGWEMRHSKLPACGMQHARRHLQLATPLADIIDGIRSALKAHYEYPHECSERILIEPTTDGPRLGPARTCWETFTANYLQQFFTVVCHNFSHTAATTTTTTTATASDAAPQNFLQFFQLFSAFILTL